MLSPEAIDKIKKIFGPRWYPLKMNSGAVKLEQERKKKKWVVAAAGRRSGKTERAKRHIKELGIERLLGDYPHAEQNYFLAAPTHDQAKAIYWNHLKQFLYFFDKKGLLEKSETERRVTIVHPTIKNRICNFKVIGLDKPERIEGIEWDGGGIDEFGNTKPGIFESNIRPALSTLGRDTFLWIYGVPEGRNHYYELAMKFKAQYEKNPTGPYGYYSWHSSEILPPEEIESAREILDPKSFSQEYEASWETKSGLMYYAFVADFNPNGNLDKDIKLIEGLPLYVGMDFNVDPMTAVCGQVVTATEGPNKGKKRLLIFKGYFMRNANTKTLAERICNDFPSVNTFNVTPCQSSHARQTVADVGQTDKSIIQSVFRSRGKTAWIQARSHNPLIRDRVNATNTMLNSKRLLLNNSDEGVRELIKDIEGIAYKEGTSDPDLKDAMRGHISAALDYMVEFHFPIRQYEGQEVELDFI